MSGRHVLVVRLGAMGDIVHALPAVASLKNSLPDSRISWVVESRWTPLLEANPYLESVIPFQRGDWEGIRRLWRRLRAQRFELAVDFQGLIKSALVATLARPERLVGFDSSVVRERPAAWFYSRKIRSEAVHVVDQNMDLAAAAGATRPLKVFPLPPGTPEGKLPEGDFVLASPLAGWGAKQWPLENYTDLGQRLLRELGIPLVLNGSQAIVLKHTVAHVSGLAGLVYATRRASAVLGLDSGPLHIASALGKSGVAIYGPTNPARNGPYSGAFAVLRSADAITSHRRTREPDPSMREISVDRVFRALAATLATARVRVVNQSE